MNAQIAIQLAPYVNGIDNVDNDTNDKTNILEIVENEKIDMTIFNNYKKMLDEKKYPIHYMNGYFCMKNGCTINNAIKLHAKNWPTIKLCKTKSQIISHLRHMIMVQHGVYNVTIDELKNVDCAKFKIMMINKTK